LRIIAVDSQPRGSIKAPSFVVRRGDSGQAEWSYARAE
jgi:hypothetical protein